MEQAIIFCRTRLDRDNLHEFLNKLGPRGCRLALFLAYLASSAASPCRVLSQGGTENQKRAAGSPTFLLYRHELNNKGELLDVQRAGYTWGCVQPPVRPDMQGDGHGAWLLKQIGLETKPGDPPERTPSYSISNNRTESNSQGRRQPLRGLRTPACEESEDSASLGTQRRTTQKVPGYRKKEAHGDGAAVEDLGRLKLCKD